MGMGALKQAKVKTNRKWTLDEMYEILKAEGTNLPSEPYLSGKGMMKGLFVKGVGKYDVNITCMGTTITCSEIVRKGSQLSSIGLGILTKGWSNIIDNDSNENVNLVMVVGEEVKRLFENRV